MDFGGGSLPDEKGIRSNFNETAYYASNIRTNDNGEIEMEFDLPDTITTWKLMMVSCTQELHWCYVEEEFISKKKLMLTANMPRFLRVGDISTISAKVTNQSEETICTRIVMNMLDESQVLLRIGFKDVEISPKSTIATSFDYVPEEEIEKCICRVFTEGFSSRCG